MKPFKYMFRAEKLILMISCVIVSLTACQTTSVDSRLKTATQISNSAKFVFADVDGKDFVLRVYYRFLNSTKPLRVYIEGDGQAWTSRSRKSDNPTPINPLALRLAAMDNSENVIYVGRPCQFVDIGLNPKCRSDYWTSHRFAPEVINSVMNVIDAAQKVSKTHDIELFGFSGGAAVAVLVASNRKDVSSIRTIAGNLDHVLLNRKKKVSQLTGSLNPVDVAVKVSGIPQIHFFGSNDDVIGESIANSYRDSSGRKDCIVIERVRGASHLSGWVENWQELLKIPMPNCI